MRCQEAETIMPPWRKHLRHSRLPRKLAIKLLRLMDNPGPHHFVWRRVTHDPAMAYLIGYIIGGSEGAREAIRHVRHDLIWDKLGIWELIPYAKRKVHRKKDNSRPF